MRENHPTDEYQNGPYVAQVYSPPNLGLVQQSISFTNRNQAFLIGERQGLAIDRIKEENEEEAQETQEMTMNQSHEETKPTNKFNQTYCQNMQGGKFYLHHLSKASMASGSISMSKDMHPSQSEAPKDEY